MKKIIWIDVGTHYAQEYSSIFVKSYYYKKILFTIFGHLLNWRLSKLANYLKEILIHLKTTQSIRINQNKFYNIFIEANKNIMIKKNDIYNFIDLPLNLAIIENKNNDEINLVKLYIANADFLSQGSSIFNTKKNISEKNYIYTLGITAHLFFNTIKNHLNKIFTDYEILLRLNCEGIEDTVIYSCVNLFGNKIKLIMGSLDDVKKIKGDKAHKNLLDFMISENLDFVEFSPDPNTWINAHKNIKKKFNL